MRYEWDKDNVGKRVLTPRGTFATIDKDYRYNVRVVFDNGDWETFSCDSLCFNVPERYENEVYQTLSDVEIELLLTSNRS